MKMIEAILQPSKLEAVKEALNEVEVERLTISDVQGFGREPTVNAIIKAGRTGEEGKVGDGKIFILPLQDCIRIRTGERGPEAI